MLRIIIRVYVVLVVVLFISACTKDYKRNANLLPDINIEISDEIIQNDELIDLIVSTKKEIVFLSDKIETLIIHNRKDTLEDIDNIKLNELLVMSTSSKTQIDNTINQYYKEIEYKLKLDLINIEQAELLKQYGVMFEKRLVDLQKKYDQ